MNLIEIRELSEPVTVLTYSLSNSLFSNEFPLKHKTPLVRSWVLLMLQGFT